MNSLFRLFEATIFCYIQRLRSFVCKSGYTARTQHYIHKAQPNIHSCLMVSIPRSPGTRQSNPPHTLSTNMQITQVLVRHRNPKVPNEFLPNLEESTRVSPGFNHPDSQLSICNKRTKIKMTHHFPTPCHILSPSPKSIALHTSRKKNLGNPARSLGCDEKRLLCMIRT